MRRSSGIKMALKFYQQKMPHKLKAFNHEFQLPDYFAPLIGDKKEVVVADLGAAAISTTGSTWPDTKVTIVASDILDYGYPDLLIPIEYQDMENLTYPDESFDIVHVVNALDHTENPQKAVEELKRVCKKGGFVYLRHTENEGEKERYAGFHNWNITRDGRMWSKDTEFQLEGFTHELKTEKSNTIYPIPEMVVSIYAKIH